MISIVVLTFNRLDRLTSCINALESRTSTPYEIIVVNNASTDGTNEFLKSKESSKFKSVNLDQNYGVTARNHGFDIAKGKFIAQVDDDVKVLAGWDRKCLDIFSGDSQIGMIGQQGGLIKTWMDIHSHVGQTRGGYVDYLTGFCMIMRNVGLKYDLTFAPFWHEELDLSFQFKSEGYRLFQTNGLCLHYSARSGPVDWDIHNRNLAYANAKWSSRISELNLEGLKI